MTTTEHSYETAPALIGTLRKYQNIAAFVGLVFLAITIAGYFMPGFAGPDTTAPQQFFRSYLVGFWYWFGMGAASLLILMTQYASGGAWGFIIRRPLEAGAKTLYVFVLGFIPILLGHESLYWWTTKEGLADKVIKAKDLYLNVPFLTGRAVIYAVFLCGMTYLLSKWSLEEDQTKSTAVSSKLESLSAPGIPIFFVLMTFCAVDYLMTLEPHWYSTVYGFLTIISWCLTLMCCMVATITMLAKYEPFNHALKPKHLHDLGKLMFALTMLWAYLQFSQLLITWSGNLPEEIVWYIKRWNGGYGWASLILLVGLFALPFLLLLHQPIKKNHRTIAMVAIYIMIVRVVDVLVMVEPNFAKVTDVHFSMSILDITAPLGFGGLWLALFFRNLQSGSLLAVGAPDFHKALNHGKSH
jgi:uncharacterized membrane protein